MPISATSLRDSARLLRPRAAASHRPGRMQAAGWAVDLQSAWTLAMRHARVRAWLFDSTPVPLAGGLAGTREAPSLSGFNFASPSVRVSDAPPDMGYLGLIMEASEEYMLGLAYSATLRHDLMMVVRTFTGLSCFDDTRVRVHRVAFVPHPTAPALYLRYDFIWLESGVVTAGYQLTPAVGTPGVGEPDLNDPRTPAILHVHCRVYLPDHAVVLRRAAEIADPDLLAGAPHLVSPATGLLVMNAHDTRHQAACVFCCARKLVHCACPVLFRRRREAAAPRSSPARAISWRRYERAVAAHSPTGVMAATWRFVNWDWDALARMSPQISAMVNANGPLATHARAISSSLTGYRFFNTGSESHVQNLVQRLLVLTGLSVGGVRRRISEVSSRSPESNVDPYSESEFGKQPDRPEDFQTAEEALIVPAVPVLATAPLLAAVTRPPQWNRSPAAAAVHSPPLPPVPVLRKRSRASITHLLSPSPSTSGVESCKSSANAVGPSLGIISTSAPLSDALPTPRPATARSSADELPNGTLSAEDGQPEPKLVVRGVREGPNLWRCGECGNLIRGKRGNLNRHFANRHANARPFQCEVPECGKRFQTRLNLVRHTRTVHDGRPHHCGECPRAFRSTNELAEHARVAHSPNSARLACPVCARCFGRRSTLNRHTSKVHGLPPTPAAVATAPEAGGR